MKNQYSIFLIDVSGSIAPDTRNSFAQSVPLYLDLYGPKGKEKYNTCIIAAEAFLNKKNILLGKSKTKLIKNIDQFQTNVLGMGGADFVNSIKDAINYINSLGHTVAKVVFLTDGYDAPPKPGNFKLQRELNPNLAIEFIMQNEYFDSERDYFKEEGYKTHKLNDILFADAIRLEKQKLEKSLKPIKEINPKKLNKV